MTAQQYSDVEAALLAYWTSRDEARIAQERGGDIDRGERATATSGGHLDRVAQLLGRVCLAAGVPASQVFYKAPTDDPKNGEPFKAACTLPGFFRPTKMWDLVVYHNNFPIVVVELKSQNGPSYSNNANNRAEEAVGNAFDFRFAREAGLIPGDMSWLGYAYVIEDDLDSRKTGGEDDIGLIDRASRFDGWTYVSRMRDLCRLLADEGIYNATWPVATSRPKCPGRGKGKKIRCPQIRLNVEPHEHEFAWEELDPTGNNYVSFVGGLTTHLAKYFRSIDASATPTIGVL